MRKLGLGKPGIRTHISRSLQGRTPLAEMKAKGLLSDEDLPQPMRSCSEGHSVTLRLGHDCVNN